jgi:hypothetical protein
MGTRNRIELTEKQVATLWQQVVGETLAATGGERIRVIYPGRMSGDSGPDFRDAVILDESGLRQGDVEIHTRSSDWYRHAHHRDARYNDIILHVAMWHDCLSATVLQSGKTVPVLCLAQALHQQAYLLPYRLPCSPIADCTDGQALAESLAEAGEARFREKVTQFRSELENEDAGQILFRSIMRALGYSRNTKPFEELARRVPLFDIESREGLVSKQALLLGTAGLLPSQRHRENCAAGEVQELEQAWHSEHRKPSPMSHRDWHFSHIYPNNSPVRRIVAQAYLLERGGDESQTNSRAGILMRWLLQLVRAATSSKAHNMLERGLIVVGDGYWRDHFDFGLKSRTRISALLGSSKAKEILINAVLPFFFAYGQIAGNRQLMESALEIYRGYPKPAENEITRHMLRQLCLEGTFPGGAWQQQGLIHIFRNYCRQGRCMDCPLATRLDSSAATG